LLTCDEPVEDLLGQFMRRRFERCKFIFEGSLQLGEWDMRPTPDADRAGLIRKMLDVMAQPI
jgi:hypothetical protein